MSGWRVGQHTTSLHRDLIVPLEDAVPLSADRSGKVQAQEESAGARNHTGLLAVCHGTADIQGGCGQLQFKLPECVEQRPSCSSHIFPALGEGVPSASVH